MSAPDKDLFQHLVQMNQAMLEALRQEEWALFSTLASPYIEAVQKVLAQAQQETAADKKKALLKRLHALQKNDDEIAQRVAARQASLKTQMSKLHQGKACCQQYSAQMPRPFE